MRTGIIYKLTNKVNGKSYVGQTLHEKQRLNTHKRLGKAKDTRFTLAVDFAIAKYGFDNFEYTVLEKDIPQEKLDEREIYWISYYDTLNTGYNLTKGGQNPVELCKKKVSMYDLDGNYIRSFDSITEAVESIKVKSISSIGNCLRYKKKSAGGYQWRYADDNSKILPYKQTSVHNYREVEQYSLDGVYLATYKSIEEAGRSLNRKKYGSISKCLRDEKQQTAYGFIWKYADKYKNNF